MSVRLHLLRVIASCLRLQGGAGVSATGQTQPGRAAVGSARGRGAGRAATRCGRSSFGGGYDLWLGCNTWQLALPAVITSDAAVPIALE